jgi:hypothetical protein
MPQYTNDIKQACVRLGDPTMPDLSQAIVDAEFGGVRKPHHALYDTYEEYERLQWLQTYALRHDGAFAV